MEIKKIGSSIYEINNFLNQQEYLELEKLINEEAHFYDSIKPDALKVSIYPFSLKSTPIFYNSAIYILGKKFDIVGKLLEKILHQDITLNKYWNINRIQEGGFISKHRDGECSTQVVFYMNVSKNSHWWNLVFHWDNGDEILQISPIGNKAIIFPWNTKHSVTTFTWPERISFVMGFTVNSEIEEKENYFEMSCNSTISWAYKS